MKPWLLETAEKYNGKVKFVAVDHDKSGDLIKEYSVNGMPTFVLVKDGKEVGRVEGTSKDSITTMIDEVL